MVRALLDQDKLSILPAVPRFPRIGGQQLAEGGPTLTFVK
jgi:hypothetical protein